MYILALSNILRSIDWSITGGVGPTIEPEFYTGGQCGLDARHVFTEWQTIADISTVEDQQLQGELKTV